MEDELLFTINENGEVAKYEEPFATVEFRTEEEFNKFNELLDLGKKIDRRKLTPVENQRLRFMIGRVVTHFKGKNYLKWYQTPVIKSEIGCIDIKWNRLHDREYY